MQIECSKLSFTALNQLLQETKEQQIILKGIVGQRLIASGLAGKEIVIEGVAGNGLGAYLNGCKIIAYGNVQEATADTMNCGEIVVHGNAGDATGYAMRGGSIYIRDSVGYRCGIHMKEYKSQKPTIVIGGRAGSFLGEYLAGGVIILLGLHTDNKPIVHNFIATGMHGGKIILRAKELPCAIPPNIKVEKIKRLEDSEIVEKIKQWCTYFNRDSAELLADTYLQLTVNDKNIYKQMYTSNL